MHNPLDLLLHDGIIDEVMGRLKSGKEADVYLVNQRGRVVAAKVYKDRAQRSFKNNTEYKEGRKVRSSRTQRAIDGGSRFGRAAAEEAWKSTEATALSRLFAADVRVPEPLMFYEGVLLMGLVTDAEGRPAPRLIDVTLDATAARAAYLDLRTQCVRMLCCEMIHGDLSPYNILDAAAGPTIIDFPQVISPAHASRPDFFFQRDFDNTFRYLVGGDPSLAPHAGDGRAIWRAYAARDLTPDFVPALEIRRPPSPPSFARPRDVRGRATPPVEHRRAYGSDRSQPSRVEHGSQPTRLPPAPAAGSPSRPTETVARRPNARPRRRRRRD